MENDIKAWAEKQWNGRLLHSGHRNVFTQGAGGIATRAGGNVTYKSKEQKAYEARFGVYNKKLVPVILAEATRDDSGELPHYTWPAQPEPVAVIPRKRVPKAKLEHAARIISKVPPDELATFLAKFGLSLSLAASIASLDNAEMIARQFLRATL
jgi:hypothetical protein